MYKCFLVAVACCLFVPVWGQRSASLRVPEVQEAPESNIDLLKKSLQTGGNAVGVSGAAAPAVQEPASATATAAQNAPAPETVVNANKKSTPSATTLDIPLEVGGQTQSVQTTVAPVKKTKATPSAKRVDTAKTSGSTAASTATATQTVAPDTTGATADEASAEESSEEAAADAELEYAVRMLEESKAKAQAAERTIPPPAGQNRPNKVPAPDKKFNPNAFRPGVTWQESKSTHFDIYTQKRSSGIPSSNMAMTFESAHQTLRRFIPWMVSGRVRVFIYQDHQSYLRHEPNAKAWTRALAYPTRGEIVVYDEPGKMQELKEVFTHELTHIFTQQFFDSHKTGRIMTPTWLDEGLAVLMEDQSRGPKGGPWARDVRRLNFQRDPASAPPSFSSSSLFGSSNNNRFTSKKRGKPVYLVPFESFMDEGSLQNAEARNQLQHWYFQAYIMVRFLLNPAGGSSPSNRMQFEQFTRLVAQGEAKRDPSTGFLIKDSRGKTVYEPYSVESALGRAYRYNSIANFEDSFWRWAPNAR